MLVRSLTIAAVLAAFAFGAAPDAFASLIGEPGERFIDPELALLSSMDAREEMLEAGQGGAGGGAWKENPTTQALASLVVPGSGQLLQGHKRGYLYMIAEIALWGGFYALEKKGSDERDEYEDFANENWDRSAYLAWYQENCVECDDCAGEYDCRPLAEYDTQEYYEDIGKYATYWRWWNIDGDEGYIAWDEYGDLDEDVRDTYWGMRGDSNRHLRQARYMTMVVLLNHMVAAVDAFFSGRGVSPDEVGRFGDFGLEFDVADRGEGMSCALTMRY